MMLRCETCGTTFEREDEPVQLLDIEEDMQGQDVVTFYCPRCLDSSKSLVWG